MPGHNGGVCGRYASSRSTVELADHFDAEVSGPLPAPRPEIAPTDRVPVLFEQALDGQERRVLAAATWGFPRPGAATSAVVINARSETAAGRPLFAAAWRARRCLLPADGWYEWAPVDGRKVKHLLHPADGEPLALAGLYRDGGDGVRVVVLTGASSGAGAWVHDRTPMVVPPAGWDAWLGRAADPGALLRPASAAITVVPVDPPVPQAPLVPETQPTLF